MNASATGTAGALITPLTIAAIGTLDPPNALALSAPTRAALEATLGRPFSDLMGYTPGPGSLNTVTFRIIGVHGGDVTLEKLALLTQAYNEAGVLIPPSNGKDLSDLMDAFDGVPFGSDMEHNLTAYGIMLALSQMDIDTAVVLADGRAGAGMIWDEVRAQLRFNAGLPPITQPDFPTA